MKRRWKPYLKNGICGISEWLVMCWRLLSEEKDSDDQFNCLEGTLLIFYMKRNKRRWRKGIICGRKESNGTMYPMDQIPPDKLRHLHSPGFWWLWRPLWIREDIFNFWKEGLKRERRNAETNILTGGPKNQISRSNYAEVVWDVFQFIKKNLVAL